MLCKCYWIVLYIVHVTAFCLGGPFFPRHCVKYLIKASKWIILAFISSSTPVIEHSTILQPQTWQILTSQQSLPSQDNVNCQWLMSNVVLLKFNITKHENILCNKLATYPFQTRENRHTYAGRYTEDAGKFYPRSVHHTRMINCNKQNLMQQQNYIPF